MENIVIKGARQHNLQGIDVEIPRGKLVVITGPSGSGKSSLAFHTLYAEGQRRYVESLSAYARQFLDKLDKPDVDSIQGLSPAIAIEQRSGGMNPRSTIATTTEIYDYLRILYAASGIPHDPVTGSRLEKMSSGDIVDALFALPEKTKLVILAPIASDQYSDAKWLIENLQRQGFVRLRVNGEMVELDEAMSVWPEKPTGIEVVVDRLVIRPGIESRLADSVETALRICGSSVLCLFMKPGQEAFDEISLLTSYRNPDTGFELPALTPKHFSFNSRFGACPRCHGLGVERSCDPHLVVPDQNKSLSEIPKSIWKTNKRKQVMLAKKISALTAEEGVDENAPFAQLPEDIRQALLFGNETFEGLCHLVERLAQDSKSNAVRRSMAQFMKANPCRGCGGRRLKPEILAVKLEADDGQMHGIDSLCSLPIEDALGYMEKIKLPEGRSDALAGVKDEITKRLFFLQEVGLSYLELNRVSLTLSGGEAQRIRLATQLGAGLSGVIYVLDEPSVGLHPSDNARLIEALKRLRDIGNTVVVVEHDEETIRAADWLIDIGPGAGIHGGRLLAAGSPQQVEEVRESITGSWLAGRTQQPEFEAKSETTGELIIRNAREHNLRGIDVAIPLGLLVAVTGPSGSGKSTLIDDILRRALARHFYQAVEAPGAHDCIEGVEQLDKMIVVDQKPLGRSPRSNPATYTGAFDLIRGLFAKLPLSRQRGYSASRFSFNLKGGRCEQCQGDGVMRLDMHFLNDVYITCDSCAGRRYNRETLEVTYKGRNIAEVLDMNAQEASVFFGNVPKLKRILDCLCEVGLGYVHLGQPANTMSGGEAQRVKLADELSRPQSGHCLYLLDEPTTGLHYNDVQVLLSVLHRLRDAGNSLVVIEHNPDVVAASDWIIDLGPGGGKHGGKIISSSGREKIS